MLKIFYKTSLYPSIACSFQRMISVTKYSINEVVNDKNKQSDKDTGNVSNTYKPKCIDEKQNKNDKNQDKQGSNVTKAIKKMNEYYD